MSEMDGWAEAVVYIDEDDVKRWNADKKLDPQKSKGALVMACWECKAGPGSPVVQYILPTCHRRYCGVPRRRAF